MIALGVGARSDVTAEALTAAITEIEQAEGFTATCFATLETVAFADALSQCAAAMSRAVRLLPLAALRDRASDCRTASELTLKLHGVGSVAEAAALAATGAGSVLSMPRRVAGPITLAVAQSAAHPLRANP